jgi:hypothetical protein
MSMAWPDSRRLLSTLIVAGSGVYQMLPLASRASISTSADAMALTEPVPMPRRRRSSDFVLTATRTVARWPPPVISSRSTVAPFTFANLLAADSGPAPVEKSGKDSWTAARAAASAAF